jgi:prolycopene isomerase
MPNVTSIQEASGVVRYLLDDSGLDIGFEEIPDAYRVILTDSGTDVRMPFGRQACIDTVEREVPGSGKAAAAYLELCGEVQEAFGCLARHEKHIDYRELMRRHGNFIRTGAYTAEQVADALSLPRKARDILYPYWCYLGVPMDRISFTIWAALLNTCITGGGGHSEAALPRDSLGLC